MIISSLKIENILSIKEAEVKFDTSGLILLEGYNYDDNRGNGSGKTAIFNAMSFALFDKLPRKITKTEVLRFGTKKGSASCDIDAGGNIYTVKRYRPTKVEFFKDGEKIDIEQEEFERKINLTYEQFLATMYTAQGSYDKRFLSLNDSKKKEFILELMNLDKFTLYHKKCKSFMKDIESSNHILGIKLNGLQSIVEIHKSSLEDEKLINKQISDNINTVNKLQDLISDLQLVSKPDNAKYKDLRDKINQKNRYFRGLKTDHAVLTSELITAERKKQPLTDIKPDTSCPKCDSPLFSVGGKLLESSTIDELKIARVEYNKKIDVDIEHISKKMKSIDTLLLKEVEIDNLTLMVDKKEREDMADFDAAISDISKREFDIKMLNIKIKTCKSKLDDNKVKKGKMAKTINEALFISNNIKANNKEKDMIEAVSGIFAPTGAPAHIMEDFVSNFNDVVQDNILSIWGNASYTIQTYKVNKDKKVTAKFSESLIINSKEISIGSLSGGEYRSLSLATDFAILDVLQKQFNISLNPIILDEPFDGLDSIGREMVIDLLKRIAFNKQIWVIDHASEAKTLFSKVLKVEKRSGISSISVEL